MRNSTDYHCSGVAALVRLRQITRINCAVSASSQKVINRRGCWKPIEQTRCLLLNPRARFTQIHSGLAFNLALTESPKTFPFGCKFQERVCTMRPSSTFWETLTLTKQLPAIRTACLPGSGFNPIWSRGRRGSREKHRVGLSGVVCISTRRLLDPRIEFSRLNRENPLAWQNLSRDATAFIRLRAARFHRILCPANNCSRSITAGITVLQSAAVKFTTNRI